MCRWVPLAPAVVVAVTLAAAATPALASEAEVLAVVARYEHAVRQGDAGLYCEVQVAAERDGTGCADLRRDGFPPRPAFRLVREGVLVRARTAAVFARLDQRGEPQHIAFVLAREGAAWRIARQVHASTPHHRPALCPPESGRFLAAGLPWDGVPGHRVDSGAVGAQVQAVSDEAFLYLRVTSPTELPPPGSTIADPSRPVLPDLPHVTIRVGAGGVPRRFSAEMGTGVGSRLTGGQRTSHLSYSMSLSEGQMLYFTFASADNPLFEVTARHAVVKIPLESLGAGGETPMAIELDRAAIAPARF